jgi:predicted DCC family thiol-disulfide oxidoreductase YuxK
VNDARDRQASAPLTVLYDGECPLCRREIAHLQRLADRQDDGAGLCFIDLHGAQGRALAADPAERARLLARFHVQRADGSRLQGAAAFAAMWRRLPGWRWLGRLAALPGMGRLMEAAYDAFLRLRPWLQTQVRRWEARRRSGATGRASPTPPDPP